jgi:hypothetical protein
MAIRLPKRMKNRLISLGRRHLESDWRDLPANQHQ